MRLREIMNDRVVTAAPEDTADVAWSRMRRHRIRHLVVVQDGDLVGVVSERDLGGRSGASFRKGRTVGELMTSPFASAKASTTLREAANLMGSQRIGCLPVLDGDQLVGIVTATDVLDELARGSTRPITQRRTLRLRTGKHQLGGRPVVRREPRARAKTGRSRPREPDSARRAPLPGPLPRAAKRQRRRAEFPPGPAHIRVLGAKLGPHDRVKVRRKLGTKLGKFADSIERVSVRVKDVNGPHGGVDQVCKIKAVLSGLPSVVYEEQNNSLEAAIDGALAGIQRAVSRTVQPRRTKPSRGPKAELFSTT